MSHQKSSLSALAVLLILSAGVPVITNSASPVVAQEKTPNAFPLPKQVKEGTVVRVNGSSSMMKINEALTKKFEKQYPKTDVKVAYNGTDAALKAVLEGKADLASIGRPLTDAEKAKGLVAVPVARNKIALFVNKDNPLKKSITINQFAQIFRGQASDLSQLKLGNGKIRLVDRLETSDTRKAFQNYPVFKSAPFKAGANAVKVKEDSTDAVIKALGKDGIGYAIADQVVKNPNVRVVPMHNVLPSDPRYPFSQPLMYVYKGEKPSPAAQAFLGYATASENQKVVEQARAASAVATLPASNQNPKLPTTNSKEPNNANSDNTNVASVPGSSTSTSTSTSNRGDTEFLWLLPLVGLLGGALWWLTRKNSDEPKTAVAPTTIETLPVTPVAPVVESKSESRMVLTARNAQNAYAYWEIPHQAQEDLRREGKRGLKLRLYDATDTDTDLQAPTLVQELNCNEREPDLHVQIPAANRDYFSEIGYTTNDDEWLKVARSPIIRVTPDTGISHTHEQVEANTEQLQAASLWANQDLVALTATVGNTVKDTVKDTVKETVEETVESTAVGNHGIGLAGAAAATAASGATLFNLFNKKNQPKTEIQQDSNAVDTVDTPNILDRVDIIDNTTSIGLDNGQLILVQRTKNDAYAYWEIPPARKADFITLGGRKLALRLYDITDVTNNTDVADINLNGIEPIQQYDCNQDNDLHIRIPANNRDYVAQLGYIRDDGSWLKVTTSEPVRISSLAPVIEAEESLRLNAKNNTKGDTNGKNGAVETSPASSTVEPANTNKQTLNWFDKAAKIGSAVAGAGAVAVGNVTKAFDANSNKEAKSTKEINNTQDNGIQETNDTQHLSSNGNGHQKAEKKQCQIILVPQNYRDAYAYWEVSEDYKQAARDQGGRRFVLRVHDSTNLDIDYQQPHATLEYACDEHEFDKHIGIPVSNRDYIAEVGYYTSDKRWIRIIRSFHVRVSG